MFPPYMSAKYPINIREAGTAKRKKAASIAREISLGYLKEITWYTKLITPRNQAMVITI
mgnify:CR=1 FL=1